MQSRAKLLGHAMHPMLVVFPLGLLATAVAFDILGLITDNSDFSIAAAYAIAAGIIGGLVAALAGLVDWLAIPGATRAKRIGLLHGAGNVVVVLLFAVSWLLRANADGWDASGVAITLGIVGLLVAAVTGWLGGELVQRLGVGVDDGAGLDAPSSLGWQKRQHRSFNLPHGHTA